MPAANKPCAMAGRWRERDVAAGELPSPMPDDELLALDEALDRLTAFNPRRLKL